MSDLEKYGEKYAENVAQSGQPIVVNHGLGTEDVTWSLTALDGNPISYVGSVSYDENSLIFQEGFERSCRIAVWA